jgi:glyoxylase-like metal-dependent hydrolase (beta-lactamase superfamily II)
MVAIVGEDLVMHLTAYQSPGQGGLLLTNAANTARMLVDGGMPDAYDEHIAPLLGKLRDDNKQIDVIYISHIDQDHIGGILHLLNDEMEWRVHDFQKSHGNPSHPEPQSPRPPKIRTSGTGAFPNSWRRHHRHRGRWRRRRWLLSADDLDGSGRVVTAAWPPASGSDRRIAPHQRQAARHSLGAPASGKL